SVGHAAARSDEVRVLRRTGHGASATDRKEPDNSPEPGGPDDRCLVRGEGARRGGPGRRRCGGCQWRPVSSVTMLEDRMAAAHSIAPTTAPKIGQRPGPQTPPAPWPDGYPEGYAVVDVETTGLARDDRIISAAVYQLDARGEVQ